MKAYTEEEMIEHIKSGVDNTCLVCGDEPLSGSWTDYNGQIRCWKCGATYQILGSHHKEEWLQEKGLTKDDVAKSYCDCFVEVPLLKAYYEETGIKVPLGWFMSRSQITDEEYKSFGRWLYKNMDMLKEAGYEEYYNWESVISKYGNNN